jgi:hypothetical protein
MEPGRAVVKSAWPGRRRAALCVSRDARPRRVRPPGFGSLAADARPVRRALRSCRRPRMGYAVPGDSLLRRVDVGRESGECERSE